MEDTTRNIILDPKNCIDDIIERGGQRMNGVIDKVTQSYVVLKDGRWFTNPSSVSNITRKHYDYINGKWVKKRSPSPIPGQK